MDGFANKIAVVTGAGSGIGRALAVELARSGAKVAISDVDTDGLACTEQLISEIGAPVRSDRLDVTERAAFLGYADTISDHFGAVHQIYNIAGIAFLGDIEVSHFKDIEQVMDIDYWGVVNGTKAFLPELIKSGDGHVINTSSMFGLLGTPGQSAYNSAKFAVRGFTEALRQEMALAGHKVAVTVVHPGYVKTAIARNAGAADGVDKDAGIEVFNKFAITSAERAARIILKAVQRKKGRVLVGPDARAFDLLVRVAPTGYQRLLTPMTARFQSPSR
jgi:NADP-dependent 3-hydroxy acid dehydrogenase YdfG